MNPITSPKQAKSNPSSFVGKMYNCLPFGLSSFAHQQSLCQNSTVLSFLDNKPDFLLNPFYVTDCNQYVRCACLAQCVSNLCHITSNQIVRSCFFAACAGCIEITSQLETQDWVPLSTCHIRCSSELFKLCPDS